MQTNRLNDENFILSYLSNLSNEKTFKLIKMMMRKTAAEKYLLEYAGSIQIQKEKFKPKDQIWINDKVLKFTFAEILKMHGSTRNRIKNNYENRLLQEVFIRKLRNNQNLYKSSKEIRKKFWLEFTDYYQLQSLYQNLNKLQIFNDVSLTIEKDVKRTHLSQHYKKQEESNVSEAKNNLNICNDGLSLNMKVDSNKKFCKAIIVNKVEVMRSQIKSGLESFARYNPFVGYCQGMNNIALFLFEQGLTEEESFFIFKRITEHHLPCDYFSSMESVMGYIKILFEMLQYTHMHVYKKLQSLIQQVSQQDERLSQAENDNIQNTNYMIVMSFTFQWFVCLYTNGNIDPYVKIIIMDHFLLEGVVVLFKAALAYFDYLEDIILKVNSFEEYILAVEGQIKNYHHHDRISKKINQTYIDQWILFLIKEKIVNSKPQNQPNIKDKDHQDIKCNKKSNICLQQIHQISQSRKGHDFFVFKCKEEVVVKQDYLLRDKDKFGKYFNMSSNRSMSDVLRIGRMVHVCRADSMTCTEDSLTDKVQFSDRDYSINQVQEHIHALQNYYPQEISSPFEKEPNQGINKQIPSPEKARDVANLYGIKLSETQNHQDFRDIMIKKLERIKFQENNHRQSILERSESMQFMRMAIRNESLSNLLNIYDRKDIQNIFKDEIDSEEEVVLR